MEKYYEEKSSDRVWMSIFFDVESRLLFITTATTSIHNAVELVAKRNLWPCGCTSAKGEQ